MSNAIQVRIEEKDAFTCIGKRLQTGSRNDRFFKDIATFEVEHEKNGFFKTLAALAGSGDRYHFCDHSRYVQGDEEFKFDIVFTIMKPDKEVPAELELEEFEVPAHRWVVLSIQAPVTNERDDAMGKLNDYARKWMDKNDSDWAFDWEIDHFPEGERKSEDYILTKWIPYKKKG